MCLRKACLKPLTRTSVCMACSLLICAHAGGLIACLFLNGPSKEDRAILDVVKMSGRLWSIDNRRLYAFVEAQRLLREHGSDRVIYTRIRVFTWLPQFDRFINCMAYGEIPEGGKSIHVKGQADTRDFAFPEAATI